MQASLLIIDSIANNRVALKVSLTAAWYDVNVAASGADALVQVSEFRPDLLLVNCRLNDMELCDFCARVKAIYGKDTPPILALTTSPDNREPLLRCGVEDVLQVPADDTLLIARIRSILRAHANVAEWRLRDGTSRALGFAEPVRNFERPISVMCLHAGLVDTVPLMDTLSVQHGISAQASHVGQAMRDLTSTVAASVIVLSLPNKHPDAVLSILSDLRANPLSRHCAILVAVPEGRSDLAVLALDLGADDATVGYVPAAELTLRLRRLNARCQINESLRATVKSGAEAAIRDPLTGLYNRRYALPHLERVAEQAMASKQSFAVMVADLDHFKRVNDWYGHEGGDAVLIECAHRLQKNMRAKDLVARIGGEEFLIVLPNTSQAEAQKAALRICNRISEKPIVLDRSKSPLTVTVSIGLAMNETLSALLPARGDGLLSPQDLIARADKALYQAKERGRNRIILDHPAAA